MIPILYGLVRDVSLVIYGWMDGPSRWRMSMVSNEWHDYCNEIITGRDVWRSKIELYNDVKSLNILQILKDVELLDKEWSKVLSGRSNVDYYDYRNNLMRLSCEQGNVELINILIRKGYCNWDLGLDGACYGGHMAVVQMLIKLGARRLNNGLQMACINGKIDIVQLLLDKGVANLNNGMQFACYHGHIDIVHLLIRHGADNWNWGLHRACAGNHIEIIAIMIQNGANYCKNCKLSMQHHLDLIKN